MMTVVAIMAGLLPIMWSSGTGSEVMQRIAVPMIGGMVSSTLLTLIVIPAVFAQGRGAAMAAWRGIRDAGRNGFVIHRDALRGYRCVRRSLTRGNITAGAKGASTPRRSAIALSRP